MTKILKGAWNSKPLQILILIVVALWGLLQVMEAIASLPQVSDLLSDYFAWQHELISDGISGGVGSLLALTAVFLLGRETRREKPRELLTKPTVICATVGIALVVSAVSYTAVFGSLSKLPFGIGEAHAVTVVRVSEDASVQPGGPGGEVGRLHGQAGSGPGMKADSKPGASGPTARQSRAKSPCGCPVGRTSQGSRGGSGASHEEWESEEPEWEEPSEPEWEEPDWEEPEEPEWEEPEEPQWEEPSEPEWEEPEEPEWEEPEW